jgi:2'-5' RNA ligase
MAGALNADDNASGHDFHPHVTVARWRRGAGGGHRAVHAVAELAEFTGRWWTAGEVVLYRSDQKGPSGPVYTPLDRVTLAGEQG